jgi:hypothetical protein
MRYTTHNNRNNDDNNSARTTWQLSPIYSMSYHEERLSRRLISIYLFIPLRLCVNPQLYIIFINTSLSMCLYLALDQESIPSPTLHKPFTSDTETTPQFTVLQQPSIVYTYCSLCSY